MRKSIYLLIVFFTFFLLSISTLYALKNSDLPLLGKVIYLDPGHGGIDSGAIYKDIYEKNINLSISLKLEEELSKLGAIVYLTRNDDYDLSVPNTINRKRSDLSRRSNIINESLCDLFLSIHLNSETSGLWSGPQVFYDMNLNINKTIAEIFQDDLNKNLNGKREIKEVNDLYLQKRVKRPGILIEVGFLSNASDRYLLIDENYQQKVAVTLKNSVLKYFSVQT